MGKLSKEQMLVRILCVLLGLIFFVFGAMKMFDVHAFVENVSNFQIAPFDAPPWDRWLAYFLPPLEVIVGLCLICGRWLTGGLVLSTGMTLLFMIAIAIVWAKGLNIECGCTDESISLGGYPTHMAILSGMLAVSVYLIIDVLFPSHH